MQGVKLLLDYVPNHTSDEHPWFEKSEEGDATYKDFYVWRNKSGVDASGTPQPPNNWVSQYIPSFVILLDNLVF